MNKRIPYILISVLILSVGETALAQVKVEESISTKALVKRGSRDVLRTGVIDLSRGHYRDSLVNYFTIQQGTGDEAEYYTYHDAIFGKNTLSYKERRPQVRYRSKDEEMIEFTSHSYPYHKYSFPVTSLSEEEILQVLEEHSEEGQDEILMNNEQTCIFYALSLMFQSESVFTDPIITNNTTFTDGRQLNAFFDRFLERKTVIPAKWKEVRKTSFQNNSVLAFINDKGEIIHAVFCMTGTEYGVNGLVYLSKSGLFTPLMQTSLKDAIDDFSIYSSIESIARNHHYADSIAIYTISDIFKL